MWWIFTDAGAREVFPDWERAARRPLARPRAAIGRHPGDARFARLVEDRHAHSPEVREWWPRYDVRAEQGGSRRLRHLRQGEMTVEHTVFTVAESPGQQGSLPPSTYS